MILSNFILFSCTNLGPYGHSNNYRGQQPNMQVPNDLVMKLMEAQQVNKLNEIFYLFEII